MLSRVLAFCLLACACFAQSPADADKVSRKCHACDTQIFSIPAKGGTHFKLTVEFQNYRWGVTGTHWYRGYPVFVQYNHSLLQAEHVTYHKIQKTIEARIDVLLENESGKQQRF